MKTKHFAIVLATLMALSFFVACSAQNKADEADDPSVIAQDTPAPYPGKLTTILLMGSMDGNFSDSNNQNYALTHILVTLDPKTRSIRFTTFPYNLSITPDDDDNATPRQLQFLYAQLGPGVVVKTLQARFGVKIDGWVVMNMHGVKNIVDTLGGLEIEVDDLSINDMADTIKSILGYMWYEIKFVGKQILNGTQITGYFMDTYQDLDEDNPTLDEEMRFRFRHRTIIDATLQTMNAAQIDDVKLLEIANAVNTHFVTDIKERKWNDLAEMAIACLESTPQYLHVPQKPIVQDDGYLKSIIYDETKDPAYVSAFVNGE